MVEPISAASVFPAWAVATGPGSADTRVADPHKAVRDFESLFIETMLEHAGIARAVGGEDEQTGAAGELLIQELSQTLADQLQPGLGAALAPERAHE